MDRSRAVPQPAADAASNRTARPEALHPYINFPRSPLKYSWSCLCPSSNTYAATATSVLKPWCTARKNRSARIAAAANWNTALCLRGEQQERFHFRNRVRSLQHLRRPARGGRLLPSRPGLTASAPLPATGGAASFYLRLPKESKPALARNLALPGARVTIFSQHSPEVHCLPPELRATMDR